MTNPYRDYKTNFTNNLPSGVTYDSTLGRFLFNGKKFYTAQSVIWYRDYILKYDPDAVATPFTPADLFASGEEGVWYEPSPSTCFTDTGGTTAASVGDPVARINDLSGNGNHATQATLASRPILRQEVTGEFYPEFDRTDDQMDVPVALANDTWTTAMAYVSDGSSIMLLHSQTASNSYTLLGFSGSTSTIISDRVILGDLFFDNTLSAATTRGEVYSGFQSANTVIHDFEAQSDFASNLAFGGYPASFSFGLPGKLYSMVLINRVLTASERAILQTYFEGKLP